MAAAGESYLAPIYRAIHNIPHARLWELESLGAVPTCLCHSRPGGNWLLPAGDPEYCDPLCVQSPMFCCMLSCICRSSARNPQSTQVRLLPDASRLLPAVGQNQRRLKPLLRNFTTWPTRESHSLPRAPATSIHTLSSLLAATFPHCSRPCDPLRAGNTWLILSLGSG